MVPENGPGGGAERMADRPVADGSGAAEGVVLVHGLWMTGVELLPMSRRLRSRGFRTHLFHYSPTGATPQEHARHLGAFVARHGPGPVHWSRTATAGSWRYTAWHSAWPCRRGG